ncbi:MAG: hypothetical protein ACMXYK_00285 [Candidatus Woesearchaeota archaeon]
MTGPSKEYIDAIKRKDIRFPGVKEYLEKVQALMNRAYSMHAEEEAEKRIKDVALTKGLERQFYLSANEVSKNIGKPCELAGIVSGKTTDSELLLDEFHVYQDQQCNGTGYFVPRMGTRKTHDEVSEKRGRPHLAYAHSHDVMGVFHSPIDDLFVMDALKRSPDSESFEIGPYTISAQYVYNIVFNQKGATPHVEVGILFPRLTDDGWIYDKTKSIAIVPRIINKRSKNKAYTRLQKEIKERVTYDDRVYDHIRETYGNL